MAEARDQGTDTEQEHPDQSSGAHEERQRKYLARKASALFARLAARDAAAARDDARASVISLEELIERRPKGGEL